MPTTVVIADDHDIIRKGLKSILEQHPEYKVIGEAEDGEEALEKAEKLKPAILLLDISMPKISGLDIIAQVKRRTPETKIIMISVHKMSVYILKAFKSGVSGYLIKENASEELLLALNRVCAGRTYLSSMASTNLVEEMVAGGGAKLLEKGQLLSEREHDVLRLVSEGKTAKEVAKVLFISPRTAENYKNSILKKLNLHKTSDLIKYALERKLVE
jgi:DNA-binding NarL/FixJ family response regulator